MALKRISGLSTFITTMKLFCKIKNKFNTSVRNAIPDVHKPKYDALSTAIDIMCEVVDNIDFNGDGVGTA